jgi:L-lactate transport
MWRQNYTPTANSIAASALVAAIPVFALLFLLGVKRKPAWMASLLGLGTTILIAVAVYKMPVGMALVSVGYGAAFGLFPIGWVVLSAILLYRVTLESGRFDVLKDSIGYLTSDPRLQVLLIAFSFGAFVEGAAGFGAPVAVSAAMLAGLGFSPFYAAALCLSANTAPVAFGSVGIPITTLAATTGLPIDRLSAGVGRICAPISLIIPAYLIFVMGGWKSLKAVLPAAVACGLAFAGTQFAISNYVGASLTDILASLAAIVALVIWFRVWKPRDEFTLNERHAAREVVTHSGRTVALAWTPYALLVILILLWGYKPLQSHLNAVTTIFPWPALHNLVQRMPPVVGRPSAYGAMYTFNWLSASGTACLIAAILGAVVSGLSVKQFGQVFGHTARQLLLAELTAAVLGLAFLMNYSGATGTLGLAFAATGALFPICGALLGWLGGFLTGSDTSSNALFGTLQVVTAGKLGLNPVLMASANSAGGVWAR